MKDLTEAHCLFRGLPIRKFSQRAVGVFDNQVIDAVLQFTSPCKYTLYARRIRGLHFFG